MKKGETIEVTIGGHKIADGVIREVGEGTVTIDVPARRVVMATRTEIENAPIRVAGPEHAILGVETQNTRDEVVEINEPVAPEVSNPAAPQPETQPSPAAPAPAETPNEPAAPVA